MISPTYTIKFKDGTTLNITGSDDTLAQVELGLYRNKNQTRGKDYEVWYGNQLLDNNLENPLRKSPQGERAGLRAHMQKAFEEVLNEND